MRRQRILALVLTASAGAAAGLLLAAGPADAAAVSTISTDSGSHNVTFVAGAGQANDLRGTLLPGSQQGDFYVHRYRFADRYPISAGAGCVYPVAADHRTVDCGLPEIGDFYPQFDIDLGDGSDKIDFAPNVGQDSTLRLGAGDDKVTVGVTFAFVDAGSGNDTVTGGGILDGGSGNDRLTGDRGTQTINGGRGNDIVTGNGQPNFLYGNSGNDTVRGGKGNDRISGGPGNDVLYGNSGNDTIAGGPGRDRISGGPGRDKITP